MSYCYMISPILSYKVCSSVSSLFPVCNCGLILYRIKEVMTRIINKLIRVFSGLSKTFGLETASEFGNTTALESLSVTKNSSRGSQTESLYIPSSSSSLIYYAAGGGLRPSRSSATLARIKYGDGWEVKKGSRAGGFSLGFSGSVSPEKLRRDSRCTGFCVDAENAAV